MLKYLIIQLDDTSVSFCHYNNDKTKPRLIDLDILKMVLFWSMKENLTVQFLYPDYQLPADYKKLIAGIDHADIVSSTCEDEEMLTNADVVVFDTWSAINYFPFTQDQAYVIRTSFADLFSNGVFLNTIIPKVSRLNVVITDVQNLKTEIGERYSQFLDNLNEKIYQEYKNNHGVQVNILTDRMMLDAMNNCGAGSETITLAPNGKFYICPGFYHDGSVEVGDIESGLNIKNPQLYQLDHAPICQICDAWHCKRCVWQNKNLTLEVNTPGREQCITAHIERNASRKLLSKIREIGEFLPNQEIPEINYLDPFDKLQEQQ
ncbi:MAG: CXXX repeat peptide maturase [Lachnoclostridium sp.]|nr:CXXX repeat peptide maturase [Lachnoclostridium sp.]